VLAGWQSAEEGRKLRQRRRQRVSDDDDSVRAAFYVRLSYDVVSWYTDSVRLVRQQAQRCYRYRRSACRLAATSLSQRSPLASRRSLSYSSSSCVSVAARGRVSELGG